MINILRLTWTRWILANEKKFKEEAKKIKDIKIDFLCYLDLYYDWVFRNIKNGSPLDEYDLFWIGGINWISMKQWLIYYFWHLKKKEFIDKFSLYKLDNTKFCQLLFANYYKFNIPKSIFFIIDNTHRKRQIQLLENKFNYPFIGKNVSKDRWEWVFLIKNGKELNDLYTKNQSEWFIFQEFVKNTGDIRVITIWKKVIWAMKRYSPSWDFKNNISNWWIWEKFEPKNRLKKICIDINKKYWLGISGIDLFVNWNDYMLIEINDLPQHKWIEKYTKMNFAKEVLEYFSKKW